MNQRIKELMKQSETECGFDPNRFAELIVRECAGVCENYRDTEWGKAAECIGDSIREHFGVEE
jgi:hypothetical protein